MLAEKQDDEAMFCDPGYEAHSTPGFH
ncbi:hypothetical protein PCAR4_100034 [Paraburkholderia caribensis]|nr:hypothetical protein PCAR4_100034 [Paraburkholderia caribensis]